MFIANLNFGELENDKVGGSVWYPVQPNSTLTPGPRKGHSMVYYQGSLILYGGESPKGMTDDNFYKFTIETRTWTILRVSGVKPGYRAYHSMNFFKRDTLIIFGGKTKTHPTQADYAISDGLIYIDLKMLDCSTPFIGDLGPSPRFGHKSAYNAYFNKGSRPFLHCIVGGLHNNYCGMDIYCIKEVELNDTNKWVYVQKNMHSAQKIDGSDEVFETAKKTIIQFKKKLEEVTKENIQVNKIYAEYFQTLNRYNKTMQEENFSSNEKKSKLQDKKIEIEKEKREITAKSRELKDYHNLLNSYCVVQREKYQLLTDAMTELLNNITIMDKMFEDVNSRENKLLLFSEVNLDSLIVKRRNYKKIIEEYAKICREYSLFEKAIYDEIQKEQAEQKEKFKNMYFIIDDKQVMDFKEKEEVVDDFSNNIIDN